MFTIKSVTNDNGDYCVPGNATPTVKMTLGTPFQSVPAGNDPCYSHDTVACHCQTMYTHKHT